MFQLFVAEHFDDATVLGVDVDAVGFEVVEVGAGGSALGGGVPPVIVCGYVAVVVDLVAAAVVVAVAVGGDEVGELEGGVVCYGRRGVDSG